MARARDEVRASMERAHRRELERQDELLGFLRAQLTDRERMEEAMAVSLQEKDAQLDRLREQLSELERSATLPHSESGRQHHTRRSEERSGEEESHIEPIGVEETVDATEGTGERMAAAGESSGAPTGERSLARRLVKLPPLPNFGGDKRDGFGGWVRKLEKYAELERWDERCKLVQFELHLVDRAERLYEVLPVEVRKSYKDAVGALRKRLHPVKQEALMSARLMKRKQKQQETVDEYAQDFEHLFEQSYGQRPGMDGDSKRLLKRDLFVQGLLLRWQMKVLPSAKSFENALHQARLAEEQEKQLTEIHGAEAVKHQQRKQLQYPTIPQHKTKPWAARQSLRIQFRPWFKGTTVVMDATSEPWLQLKYWRKRTTFDHRWRPPKRGA